MKKTMDISGMSCAHCVAHVEKALKAIPGIEKVSVELKKNQAYVQGPQLDDSVLKAAISEAGYTLTAIKEDK